MVGAVGAVGAAAGGVLVGVVCSTATASMELNPNALLKNVFAIGFGASVVAGVSGKVGGAVAGAVVGAVLGAGEVAGTTGVNGAITGGGAISVACTWS